MKKEDILDDSELTQPPEKNDKEDKTTDIHKGSWMKSVIKNGKWYLMGSIATKAMLFFLLPVYTRYLTPDEYGIFNTLNVLAQILPIFISFALDAAFGRFFHDYKKDPEKLKTLFSTVYWFVASYGTLMLVLVIFSSQWWLMRAAEVPMYPYAFLTFLPPLFMQLGGFGLVFLKQSLKSKMTSIVEALGAMTNILVTLPLLVYWDLGVIARLLGNVGASGFIFIVMTFYFVRQKILVFRFDKTMLRILLVFSIPLIPSLASKWINMLSDRLILYQYIDMEAVGLYSLAANIAILLLVLQDSMSQIIQPVSISGLVNDKERTKAKMADFALMMWIIMTMANLGAFLFSKDVITIFAEKSYENSYIFIPILGFTYVLGSQYRFFSYILQFHKETGIISRATISSAVANVVLNIIFIPIYGAIAAPFATVSASLVLLLWIGIAAQKIEPIPMDWKKLGGIALLYFSATAIGILFLFHAEVTLLNFLLKGIFFIGIALIALKIGNYIDPMLKYIKDNLRL